MRTLRLPDLPSPRQGWQPTQGWQSWADVAMYVVVKSGRVDVFRSLLIGLKAQEARLHGGLLQLALRQGDSAMALFLFRETMVDGNHWCMEEGSELRCEDRRDHEGGSWHAILDDS